MATCTYGCFRNVINLGNSIIGVSILAMPYCFSKCGILLSLLLVLSSGVLTRMACHLLLKAAIMARRRNFEFLAFHTFGSTGKLSVEVGIIGFLIGVCIAFFVVVGDLGPPLASQFLLIENTPNLRAEVLIFLGVFVALPLGMLRKVDSLTSFSALSIAFYICLVLKIVGEALPKLANGEWQYQVNWWQPAGILPCLPIFSMALSCQTQLFEFFDTLTDPSLKRMNSVVTGAINLCSAMYILVGLFGYIAFSDQSITGNILVRMTPSFMTDMIKLGFIVTVVISFPLCLFPCRTSLHSLLFKQGHHDMPANYIPDHRFRALTLSLVTVTIGISIMLPNIEFVLGIIGSTIGTIICLILPAFIFIHATNKNTNERRMAQLVLVVGIFILVVCTYSTLQDANKPQEIPLPQKPTVSTNEKVKALVSNNDLPPSVAIVNLPQPSPDGIQMQKPDVGQPPEVKQPEKKKVVESAVELEPAVKKPEESNRRQEPVVPQEPIEVKHKAVEDLKQNNGELDPEALKKEDKEIKIQKDIHKSAEGSEVEKAKQENSLHKQEELLRNLEVQHEVQKKMLEEHKKLLEELKMQQKSGDDVKKDDTLKVDGPKDNIKPKAPLKPDTLPVIGSSTSSYLPQEKVPLKDAIPNAPDETLLKDVKDIPNPIGLQMMKQLRQVGRVKDVEPTKETETDKQPVPLQQNIGIQPDSQSNKESNNKDPLVNTIEKDSDLKEQVKSSYVGKQYEDKQLQKLNVMQKSHDESSLKVNETRKDNLHPAAQEKVINLRDPIIQPDSLQPKHDFRKVKRDVNPFQEDNTGSDKSTASRLETPDVLQNMASDIQLHMKSPSLSSVKTGVHIDSHDGLKNEMRKLLEVSTMSNNTTKPKNELSNSV